MSHSLTSLFSERFHSELPRHVASGTRLATPTLPGASAALASVALSQLAPSGLTLIITPSATAQERIYGDLCSLGRESGLTPLLFPFHAETDTEAMGLRLNVLRSVRARAELPASKERKTPLVISASIQALLQPIPDPDAVQQLSITLRVGDSVQFDQLVTHLVLTGYARVVEVDSPGQIAVRGGILDLWPPATPQPWRAEFFGSELESLRLFDPATQCSIEEGKSLWIPPCSTERLPTVQLLSLLPRHAALLWFEHDQIQHTLSLPSEDESPLPTWAILTEQVTAQDPQVQLFTGDPPPAEIPSLPLAIATLPGLSELGATDAHHPELLMDARKRLLDDLEAQAKHGTPVIICADTAGTCELLVRELGPSTHIHVQKNALSGGFSLPGLIVAAQSDLYAIRKQALRRSTTPALSHGGRVEHAADLEPGALVVHIDHGIGRFLGSTEIELNGNRSEVFTLEYADGAKLHVPVSHAHLLSRYVGVSGHKAKLHRLGGRRWQSEKVDAERAVADLAASLLETQARRSVSEGIAYQIDPPWLHEFEAAFPYQETVDQVRVIAEVKKDMAASKPMDRLICGDAGYGKTEIAMRAAFIAVMNGRQVAILVPTTVLAEQHFETFSDRMNAYPVRIDVVSRFQPYSRRKKILASAAEGNIDILIGTHALLAEGVSFKDLGLLIIDEEQRFGVAHKERLKHLRQIVDVLTLSATPIPRTLYMSMTGARDLSLLQTPPRERLAVETKVARDNDNVIRTAIQQELNRNGQVYFLYNRVMSIGLMMRRLEALVPEARISVAHGQMPAGELASVMHGFEAGEVDVLLCTTLVESGLDIPRANTILVHRADRFGIADLYQLRGRVGRSSQKGYAWLLLPEYGHIDEDARQRIAALQKHSGLGAGFNLALRDLEIRGAGNLLGATQSGHIAAIGFGLYCQLLRRTISRLKGELPPLLVDVDLSLNFLDYSPGAIDTTQSACIPYHYIEEEGQRMILHRRLAEAISKQEVDQLSKELADRYGKLPAPVLRLLRVTELRIAAAQKEIGRIETREGKIFIYPAGSRIPVTLQHAIPLLKGNTPEEKITCIIKSLPQVRRKQVRG
jgi:transcription-repair coupling factor (superfamily II helicase)